MPGGLTDEEDVNDQDKGPLTYQETKVFNAEPHIISVYDNSVTRVMTFEVYGLDTQDMLHLQYKYDEFDLLFRFNAELMNPNRKEGRFHWVSMRLEISSATGERKLRLANEPTKEIPEKPIYEKDRKIPTGRMDLKERQRLREQMDMLNIRRDENIAKKRAKAKEKFLKHIFAIKEEHERKRILQEEKIEQERVQRQAFKIEHERKEREKAAALAEKAKHRRKAVEVKEGRTEEQEEEELRGMRLRWKQRDAEKAEDIAEAKAKTTRERERKRSEKAELDKRLSEAQANRLMNWKARDKRVKKKEDEVIAKALAVIVDRKRRAQYFQEKNLEYIKESHKERQPYFEAQLERTAERKRERDAEQELVRNYEEKRTVPKKIKTKGRNAVKKKEEGDDKHHKKKAGKKKKAEDGEGHDEDHDGKKDNEALVDAVEVKMRAEMELQRQRMELEQKREEKLRQKHQARIAAEAKRMEEYREKMRVAKVEKEKEAEERRLIYRERNLEKLKADERKKSDVDRLGKVRAQNEEKQFAKQLAALAA